MYNKLFTKILDSSIWLESQPTRLVWLTLIAAMDADGFAPFAAIGNVANRARVSLDEAAEALRILESDDPESANKSNDGKRIERVPGGWMVLNAQAHRDMVTTAVAREQTRDRVARHRLVKRTCNAPVTLSEAEAYTEEEEEEEPNTPPAPLNASQLVEVWNAETTEPLPRCLRLGRARLVHVQARLSERPLDEWVAICRRVQASAFCRGQNARAWVASFDWLMANDENATKVLEGKYDDRAPGAPPVTSARPAPNYDESRWCYHLPACPSREYHAICERPEEDR